jgi:hypothetical protein
MIEQIVLYKNKNIDISVKEIVSTFEKKKIDNNLFEMTDLMLNDSTLSINEQMRLYEGEKTLLPLMFHENYLSQGNPKKSLIAEHLIMDSISLGDTIETLMYNEQKWELSETFGITSLLIPLRLFHLNSKSKSVKDSQPIQYTNVLTKYSTTAMRNKQYRECRNKLRIMDFDVMDVIRVRLKEFLDKEDIDGLSDFMIEHRIDPGQLDMIFRMYIINDDKKIKVSSRIKNILKKKIQESTEKIEKSKIDIFRKRKVRKIFLGKNKV